MDTGGASLKGFRRSTFMRVVAVLATATPIGCYQTWTMPIAPPAPGADSTTLTLGKDLTVTLLRPEPEGDSAVWGWTRDRSYNARTVVSSAGIETAASDSAWVRIPLIATYRRLELDKTILLTGGIILAGAFAALSGVGFGGCCNIEVF